MDDAEGMREGTGRAATPRARRFARLMAGMVLCALGAGCATAPHVLSRAEQHPIDRRLVEYPSNYEFRRYMAGLTAPTAFDFDAQGNLIIAMGGLGDDNHPQVIGVRPDGHVFNIYPYGPQAPIPSGTDPFDMFGPIGGLACYRGKIYVSHRDREDFGVITAFDYFGGHRTVIAGLPAQGEYGVTQLAVEPRSGTLYFGIGTATNSGVVGMDDYEMQWLQRHSEVHDILGHDKIRTYGEKFTTPNPFAQWLESVTATTGGFQTFNSSDKTLIRERSDKPNGAICSVPLNGGPIKIEATGIHNPRGLAFSQFGLYFTNGGMEPRGSRPIMNDPDGLLVWVPGTYYGWPDYSVSLRPITEPFFQPPEAKLLQAGYRELNLLVNSEASNLVAPSANTLLQGTFPSQSGAAGLAFIPDNSPLSADFANNAIVAMSGDRAPFSTGGMKLLAPVGFKVMRVDVDRKQVHEFIHNTQYLPASMIPHSVPDELERPIDVKVGPDGALYVLDLGRMHMDHGRPKVEPSTGQVFRLLPAPTSAVTNVPR